MAWWKRRGPRSPDSDSEEKTKDKGPDERPDQRAGAQGALPGLGTLLRDEEGGNHSILDLGPALPANFRIYTRFARRIRFLDLPKTLSDGGGGGLPEVPPHPTHPYDMILGWDLLDRLPPEARPDLLRRIIQVSASEASLHVLLRASGERSSPPLRFRLLSTDRVVREPTGAPVPTRSPILPAELERLIDPFQVTRAFTLKGGLREYVARLPRS
jgi:hypothetical protein